MVNARREMKWNLPVSVGLVALCEVLVSAGLHVFAQKSLFPKVSEVSRNVGRPYKNVRIGQKDVDTDRLCPSYKKKQKVCGESWDGFVMKNQML